MRFIKGKSGFDLMEVVERLNQEEYRGRKREEFEGFRGKSWFVPESAKFEKILVLMFGRSNKWLSRPVKRFKCGKNRIDTYQFNCTHVVVEHVGGKNLVEVKFHNIDDRFRFSVIAALMSEDESLKRIIDKHIVKSETLYMVSMMWREFVSSGLERGFGRWANEQPQLKRLIEYRKTHTTRDSLHFVSEDR